VGGLRGFGPAAECVGSRTRLAQGVGPYDLTGDEPGQVLTFLLIGSEEQDWNDREVALRSKRATERGASRHMAADDERRRFVHADATEFLRSVHAQQSKL